MYLFLAFLHLLGVFFDPVFDGFRPCLEEGCFLPLEDEGDFTLPDFLWCLFGFWTFIGMLIWTIGRTPLE